MVIKRATKIHMEGIDNLLSQVLMVHHNGRPDLFRANARKYTDPELEEILADPKRPIFVAVDEQEHVMGYAFCVYQQHVDDNILTDIRTLYIDDICVDENCRKSHVGSRLYEYVVAFARREGFYNVTLNVWSCNPTAMKFYEACGLVPYKVGMEKIL
ncbi:MAG: GNAT family N-acetyltransferase [Clostridiales bacterium]|nr:GNAT family N-acetyltransferase [Clostridiales bacterium]